MIENSTVFFSRILKVKIILMLQFFFFFLFLKNRIVIFMVPNIYICIKLKKTGKLEFLLCVVSCLRGKLKHENNEFKSYEINQKATLLIISITNYHQ